MHAATGQGILQNRHPEEIASTARAAKQRHPDRCHQKGGQPEQRSDPETNRAEGQTVKHSAHHRGQGESAQPGGEKPAAATAVVRPGGGIIGSGAQQWRMTDGPASIQ